jgi:hypothetical protein
MAAERSHFQAVPNLRAVAPDVKMSLSPAGGKAQTRQTNPFAVESGNRDMEQVDDDLPKQTE